MRIIMIIRMILKYVILLKRIILTLDTDTNTNIKKERGREGKRERGKEGKWERGKGGKRERGKEGKRDF